MTPDDPPQTDPATIAAWLIQKTPRAQAMTPEERRQLQQSVEALIIHARGPQPTPPPGPYRRWQ